MNQSAKTILIMILFLLFGAGNSILGKIMFSLSAPNFYGVESHFEKPLFGIYSI